MACEIHPNATTAIVVGGRRFCASCQTGMQRAASQLDGHVTPRDCFVWYKNSHDGWQPIEGTGCAHYVSHQLNIRVGGPGQRCLAGFTYRVPDALVSKTQVTGGLAAVQGNDNWVNTSRRPIGIVTSIGP